MARRTKEKSWRGSLSTWNIRPSGPGELPVDPAVPNPSRHWPTPLTVLALAIIKEGRFDCDRGIRVCSLTVLLLVLAHAKACESVIRPTTT
jgi:hypothetical protein